MFQSSTILRELVQSLAKVTLLLKQSVKLCRRILCGDVAACHGMACVLYAMLPYNRIINNDVISPNVLT